MNNRVKRISKYLHVRQHTSKYHHWKKKFKRTLKVYQTEWKTHQISGGSAHMVFEIYVTECSY